MSFENRFNHEGFAVASLKRQLEETGFLDQVPYFNDVLSGREKPESESDGGGYGKVLSDFEYKGNLVDIYHTDANLSKQDVEGARVYLHQKGSIEGEE